MFPEEICTVVIYIFAHRGTTKNASIHSISAFDNRFRTGLNVPAVDTDSIPPINEHNLQEVEHNMHKPGKKDS
jgi:hypothetical protein